MHVALLGMQCPPWNRSCSRWLLSIWLIACLATSGLAVAESWIVAWKEQPLDSDASAKVLVCDRMQDAGDVTWYYKDGRKKCFAKDQFFRSARIDSSVPAELTNQEQFNLLKYHFERLSEFNKQFPNAGPILKPRLTIMRAMIDHFAAGKVYHSGNWITRAEYATLIAKPNSPPRTASAAPDRNGNPQAANPLELQHHDAKATQQPNALALQQMEKRNLAYATAGGIAIYLLVWVVALARRLRKLVWLMVLAPCAWAGWLTYQEGGCEWTKPLRQQLVELPELLQLPEMPDLSKWLKSPAKEPTKTSP